MDPRSVGLWLAFLGIALVLLGLFIYVGLEPLSGRPGWLRWFGRLPGDIHHRGENTTVFIPITSMLVVSLGLSLAISLLRRLF